MKRLGVLLLAANSLFAADFLNGQAARAVIGQPHFNAQLPGPASALYPGNMLLGAVSGLASANGMLFVVDSSPFRTGVDPQNNRVLIYNSIFGPGDPNSTAGPTQLPPATAEPPQNKNSVYWWCPVCGGRADVVVGQTDFNGTGYGIGSTYLRTPTAVATDGVHMAIADTDNNRVLLWNQIPTANGQAADVVLGQPDFNTVTPNTGTSNVLIPAANTLRGPEGVWIQGGQLYVADTMNNRVLVWKSWPATNGQAADMVLGQPNFTTQTQGDLTKATIPPPSASNMLNPVSVTSDGTRLFVSDLGQNRVLIWNSIPAQNDAPADVALGQPDLVTTSVSNNAFTTNPSCTTTPCVETPAMCTVSNGKDTNGNPTYPPLCEYTLDVPRYALSDGTRLFIADGGNDRVLIYQPIPTTSGAPANVVIGQTDFISDKTTDSTTDTVNAARIASADSIRTPGGLAWDGTNLFVSEAFSRRVLVFTVGSSPTLMAPRNAASMEVFAGGSITLSGTPAAGDVLTATITDANGTAVNYTYTAAVSTGLTLASVTTGLANAINSSNSGAGDPNVTAIAMPTNATVEILARVAGPSGNNLTLGSSASSGSGTSITSTSITGGSDASHVAPGTLVAIFGQNLTDGDTISVTMSATNPLPTRVGTAPKSVEAFANGIPMPLLYVSPGQINAQIPYEIAPATGISVYVRTTYANGTIAIAQPAGLPVAEGVPGFFAFSTDADSNVLTDPRPAIAVHYSSSAMAAVDLELSTAAPVAGNTVSITVGSNTYTYTILATDTTLDNVRDGLIALINQSDPNVTAFAGGQWDRVVMVGQTPGTAANGLAYSVSNSSGGSVTASALSSAFCCANVRGALVTAANPALPGEIISLYATGLGLTTPVPTGGLVTGLPYSGVFPNKVADFSNNFVSGAFGGATAQILNAALLPGTVGVYEIDLLLGSSLTANSYTTGTVAQELNVTNIVTIPVGSQ